MGDFRRLRAEGAAFSGEVFPARRPFVPRSRRFRSPALAALACCAAVVCGCDPDPRDNNRANTGICGWTAPDTDNDGLPDFLEDTDGDGQWDFGECNPASPDSDGDGILDVIEVGCDGVWEFGVETRCEVRDTDGDGIDDGVEDANRNGVWEAALGETHPAVADTDEDGCDDGAEGFTDPLVADTDGDGLLDGIEGDCDAVVLDALCETDPTTPDTDGDGLLDEDVPCPGQICPFFFRPSRPPLKFLVDAAGGWKVALHDGGIGSATATALLLLPPSLTDASAGVADVKRAPGAAVAVVRVPLAGSGVVDVGTLRAEIFARITADLPMAAETLSLERRGREGTSWDGFPLLHSVRMRLSAAAPRTAGEIRRGLVASLLATDPATLDIGLPGDHLAPSDVVLGLSAVLRGGGADVHAVVVLALVPASAWETHESGARELLVDYSNGSAIAEPGDAEEVLCPETYQDGEAPVDLLVVSDPRALDPGAPALDPQELFPWAVQLGVSLRVGVTDMSPANGGALCPMWQDTFGSDPVTLGDCILAPWTGGVAVPTATAAFETARAAVLGHLPRLDSAARIRPGAALGLVLVASEMPAGLLAALGPGPSAAEARAWVAEDAALYRGEGGAWLPPGLSPFQPRASVSALLSGLDPWGASWIAGHAELADALDGVVAAPDADAALEVMERAAGENASMRLGRDVITAGTLCDIGWSPLARTRSGGFFIEPSTGAVLADVPWNAYSNRVCYTRRWLKGTP